GQYVGVTMQLTVQPDAVVVPSIAIQSSEQGNFVYKVVKDKAVVQPVIINRQVGDLAVISSGLEVGEQVITLVPRNLRPNMKVTPSQAPTAASGTLGVAAP
ncbi:MAG: efflux RND transporter periplasmic adaptor subunit, partial [Gammaproteobacteria bacterium]